MDGLLISNISLAQLFPCDFIDVLCCVQVTRTGTCCAMCVTEPTMPTASGLRWPAYQRMDGSAKGDENVFHASVGNIRDFFFSVP
jgi:hypothetical protein